MMMQRLGFTILSALLCVFIVTNASTAKILMSEDFEGLPLGPFQDEVLTVTGNLDPQQVWTKTPPEGWTLDDSWMPEAGVRDWRGWSFANAIAWAYVAGDQRRSEFTNAKGTVAIADSDEWDDMAHDAGTWDATMSSTAIDIQGLEANSLVMTFDSSWRPEGEQEVNIVATFDDGSSVEILYWNSYDGDPNFHNDESTNETVTVSIPNPAGAQSMVLTWGYYLGSNNWFWAIDNIVITSGNTEIYSEDFEGLPLGPFLDENLPDNVGAIDPEKVWTKTPPEGWSVNDEYMPEGGVRDWRGWAFANATAWATVAGDQRRLEFTKAKGVAAISDPDEYDDMDHEEGAWEGYLISPSIDLTGVEENTVTLKFDSSWRPESPQEAAVEVSFDGGAPEWVLYWTSIDGDPDYHDDNSTNETVIVEINNPAGAQSMVLTWGVFYAGNNWFWAIDNIVVSTPNEVGSPQPLPFSEDFEGLTLGSSVDEEVPADAVWTKTPPEGWTIDDSGVAGMADGIGVTEWMGWSFADKDWWVNTAGDQERSQFTLGTGTVAITDPDEWDDIGSPGDIGTFNSLLSTPPIDVEGVAADTLVLQFDSSWRDEDSQTANITVSYDGGAPIEVMRWSSDSADANFHDDFPNEHVTVDLNNPADASTLIVTFGMLDATNDWWWAIDNISISEETSINNWQIFE